MCTAFYKSLYKNIALFCVVELSRPRVTVVVGQLDPDIPDRRNDGLVNGHR